jgi:hypothetical protein
MERGVYFDAWFPRQHCYHPSLPPRRFGMVDDLVEYGATMLVWSALGGGSISLPYLEQEAWEEIPARLRVYGYMNDAEFIAECGKRGIDVYGIVFEVQGWEFPVELNEDEDRVLAMNELRGAGKQDWIGLREFNANRYPKLWKRWEDYFPDGLVNSDGDVVTNVLEECVSRDIHGEPCHSTWVECPDRNHFCYLMDRNNPVWREYLKAIIRIQIDAGVQGVQLDEADLPYFANRYGGCFCKDCVKQFRAYLQQLPADRLPAELTGVDLASFHYGKWLLEQGYDFKSNQENTPLFWEYLRFQRSAIVRYFAELTDYARQYAASKGRTVKVSGNLYRLAPHYYAFAPHVDVLITETDNQGFRQPAWNRYSAGFAGDKPVVAVENPYGGVVPDLSEKLKGGRGYDLFRIMQYEAAALGINMSIPYGAWLGSVIVDSFNPPHELCVEVSRFLKDNERLYSTRTYSETALVYSVESTFQLHALRREQGESKFPFWQVAGQLADAVQPFDVVVFPDGELRPDELEPKDLARYRNLVVPECRFLTEAQRQILLGYLESGGRVVVLGTLGANLPDEDVRAILDHPHTVASDSVDAFSMAQFVDGPQVVVSGPDGGAVDMALNIHEIGREAAVHFIRYDYDEQQDAVPVIPELTLDVRLVRPFRQAKALSPDGSLQVSMEKVGSVHRLTLRDVPLYGVVLLQG